MKHLILFENFNEAFWSDWGKKAFSETGLEVTNMKKLLKKFGVRRIDTNLIDFIQGSVGDAPKGVIQDPAGTAIGAGVPPSQTGSGGASGALYKKFTNLDPIPEIVPGESVMNPSGERMIHTFSPHLGKLSPRSENDQMEVIKRLSNAYERAIDAYEDIDGSGILNLVPISAGIFAGDFRGDINHLHPSYTIAAILIAANKKKSLPKIALYNFSPEIHEIASNLIN